MGFKCGIVGLPNVGKSTLFNAITAAKAEAANFPFCTIDPNTGIVKVPDPRLQEISKRVGSKEVLPTHMTFIDIAGLVKGASKGEGLGNQFLGHIRETSAVAHVVRCFEDSNITHVEGSIDPIRDIQIIDTELMLKDLDLVDKKFDQTQKLARTGNKEAGKLLGSLTKIKTALEAGTPIRQILLDKEDLFTLRDFHFLTQKKVMYVANVSEDDLLAPGKNKYLQTLIEFAKKENAPVIPICGKIESEISELNDEEKIEFLKDFNLAEPGLNQIIRTGYDLLGLQTYFTAGEKETRAWTIQKGWTAPQAAGVIHTDFERGFIKAEVYTYNDLVKYGTPQKIKDAGLLRIEGKEYIVQEGDILHFRFNT